MISTKLKEMPAGFIGLGLMGKPMAKHLAAAGAALVVWNRSRPAIVELEAAGASSAASAADLAAQVSGGILCLCLPRTESVEEVLTTGGVREALGAGTLIVDFSTISVSATRRFAGWVAQRGASWCDAPVSGGQVGAEAANLTIMAGGSEEDFARALPFFEVVGEKITHMGPAGSGQVTKLANQLIVSQTIDAVAQALVLAERAGVDPAKVREALRGGFAESRILELHGDRMVRREFLPGGRSELQLKDVRLIAELADELGLDFPTVRNSLRQWERLVDERGLGGIDHSGLFRLYEG